MLPFNQTKFYQFLLTIYEALLQRLLQMPARIYGITLVLVALAAGLVAIEAIATALAFGVVCLAFFILYGLGLGVKKGWQAARAARKGAAPAIAQGQVQAPGSTGGSKVHQLLSALYGLVLSRILRLPPTLIGALLIVGCIAGAVILVEAIATLLVVGALGVVTFALYGLGLLCRAGGRAFMRHRAREAQKRERLQRNSALYAARSRSSRRTRGSRPLRSRKGAGKKRPATTAFMEGRESSRVTAPT